MKQLVKVSTREGSPILIEIDGVEGELVKAGFKEDIASAKGTFEEQIDILRPIVTSICKKINDMKKDSRPNSVSAEFGLGFKINSEGILRTFISTEANANIKINFKWELTENSQ